MKRRNINALAIAIVLHIAGLVAIVIFARTQEREPFYLSPLNYAKP